MLRVDPELWKAFNAERRFWYIRQGKLCLLLAGKDSPLKKYL